MFHLKLSDLENTVATLPGEVDPLVPDMALKPEVCLVRLLERPEAGAMPNPLPPGVLGKSHQYRTLKLKFVVLSAGHFVQYSLLPKILDRLLEFLA